SHFEQAAIPQWSCNFDERVKGERNLMGLCGKFLRQIGNTDSGGTSTKINEITAVGIDEHCTSLIGFAATLPAPLRETGTAMCAVRSYFLSLGKFAIWYC